MKNFTSLIVVLLIASIGVAAPYQYYNYQYQQYYYQPAIIGVPVNEYYYYTIGDDDAKTKRIADELLKRLKEEGAAPLDREVGEASMFRLVKGKGSGNLDAQVFDIFNTSCVKCHKPGAPKPGVQLFTADRKLFKLEDKQKERARRLRVYSSIESGEMPKGAPSLTASQKLLIKRWSEQ